MSQLPAQLNAGVVTHPLGHVRITSGARDDLLEEMTDRIGERQKQYCMPLNMTKYVMSKTDEKLRKAVTDADYVIADGVPIRWLSRRAGLRNVHRITGVDLAESLLGIAARKEWTLFLLGASPANLASAMEGMLQRFPGLTVAGMQHGYFQEREVPEIVERINECRPDILLLGLGLPQKEYFLHDFFEQLDVSLCLPVGGAFDIWAGTKKRAPAAVQSVGLEWLYRSLFDVSRAGLILRYGIGFATDLVWYRQQAE